MKPTPVDFGEWRPDIALIDTKFAADVENVFAGINSYLPFPSLVPFSTNMLPGPARGFYSARTLSGEWKTFAGTETGLYLWTATAWVDVSRTTGGAYNVPLGEMWVFEQSGQKLVAVNVNDNPQVFDIDSGTDFADLAGSPPRAGHVKQIGDFLFLSRLSTNARIIQWSAINDITGWVIGTNLSDMQEFPDGGPVQGMAGSEIGYVVQDRTIRTMQFLPGDTTFIFNFSRVLNDRGSISKYGFSTIGNILYFLAEDGFYSISGQNVTPIGADKVNEWFLTHSSIDKRDVVHCLASVNKPRIVWVFHTGSTDTFYDEQIIFDWSNGRWSRATVPAQIWGLVSTPNLDLDTDGPEVNDVHLDTPPFPAAFGLDSFAYVGGRPLIGAIDDQGRLCSLTGPNMPATLETAEVHLAPGMRAFVNEVYPIDDATGDNALGTISNGIRERMQGGPPVWSPPIDIEPAVGSAFVMTSARLHRFRRFIPRGSTWTHAQGVLVNAQPDGEGVSVP